MTQGLISPDTTNLLVGKGSLLFQPTGAGSFYAVGNVPTLTLTPKTTLLDHFDSQAGTKTKDLTVVTEKTMEVKMQMEEFTAHNISLLVLGDIDNTDPTQPIVNIFTQASVTGHLKYYAANDVGPRWYIDLPSVTFNPSGDLAPISDAFASMEVTGTVNAQSGIWGTIQLKKSVATLAPENVLGPNIGGYPISGDTLTANVGVWIGATSFTYLWKASGGAPVNSATSKTLVLAAGDVGKTITVDVTAHNSIGTTGPVTSAAT